MDENANVELKKEEEESLLQEEEEAAAYYARKREASRRYYAKNPEKCRAYNAKRVKKSPTVPRIIMTEEERKEKQRLTARTKYLLNKDQNSADQKLARLKRRNAMERYEARQQLATALDTTQPTTAEEVIVALQSPRPTLSHLAKTDSERASEAKSEKTVNKKKRSASIIS